MAGKRPRNVWTTQGRRTRPIPSEAGLEPSIRTHKPRSVRDNGPEHRALLRGWSPQNRTVEIQTIQGCPIDPTRSQAPVTPLLDTGRSSSISATETYVAQVLWVHTANRSRARETTRDVRCLSMRGKPWWNSECGQGTFVEDLFLNLPAERRRFLAQGHASGRSRRE